MLFQPARGPALSKRKSHRKREQPRAPVERSATQRRAAAAERASEGAVRRWLTRPVRRA
jgi:hypothetical protein